MAEKETQIGRERMKNTPQKPMSFKLKKKSVKTSHLDDNAVTADKIANGAVQGSAIAEGSVGTSNIADGAVTTSKMGDNSVTTDKIASESVTNQKIADNTITTDKIADEAITGSKIAPNTITGNKLADGAITSVDIQDNTLSGSKLMDGTISGEKLMDSAVSGLKIKDNTIDGRKIADGTIQSLDIQDNSIPGSKLADGTITTEKLQNGIISNDKLANGTLTGSKFLDESITGEKIMNGTIPGSKIMDDTIEGVDIINGSIDGSKLKTNSVDGSKLADDAVDYMHLKANSITNDKIADDAVSTEKIKNNTITGAKFADNSITTDKLDGTFSGQKIADNTLVGSKIVDNTITGDKIVDNTVPGSKLQDGTIQGVDIQDGTLSGAKLVDGSVSGAKIADNAITSSHLLNNSIPGSKIQDGTIENVDLKDGTLDGSKLKDNTIQTAKIADSAVTEAKLAANAVTTDKIDAGAVTTAKIANEAVTEAKIDDDAVTSAKMASGAVTTDKILNDAVTTDKIDSGAVTTSKIADTAVTEGKIDTGAVTEGKIASNAVTNTKIADGSVTEGKIGALAVTEGKIASNSVTEGKIAAGSVSTAKLADSSVTTGKIADVNVTTAKIADEAVTTEKLADGAITSDKIADEVITELQTIMDDVPTKDSVKPVSSGGVYAHGSALDVSLLNADTTTTPITLATYADLSAALAAIPAAYQSGGMSVKFVLTSDNNYVQYRCMAQNFTTDVTQWQGVDDEPTAGSKNLVKSDGVYNAIPLLYKKELTYSHTSRGKKTVAKGCNFLKGHEYKITVDGTNESAAFTASIADSNNVDIFVINSSIAAGSTVTKVFIPANDYVNVRINSYFNATSGSAIYTVEDVSISNLREDSIENKEIASNAQGVNATKSITTSGTGHSSTTDKISLYLKAGDSFSFEINPDTAVVRDIHVFAYKDGSSVFTSDSLSINKRYTFTVNNDADSVGVYFVNTTIGTISWNVVSGLQLAFEKINDTNASLAKSVKTDTVQSFTDVEKRTAYENLGLYVNEKRSVNYTNSGTGNKVVMTRLNFQKDHEYRITVDTTNASAGPTLNIIDANDVTIQQLSAGLPANTVSTYIFIPDNDYIGAKILSYFPIASSTVIYSIEDLSISRISNRLRRIDPIYTNTFWARGSAHSSENNRVEVDIKAGTCVNLRVNAVTAVLKNDCAFYGVDKNDNVILLATGKVGEDNIIVPNVDIAKIGVYFQITTAGTVTQTYDQSSYYTDKYLMDKANTESTIVGMNTDAFDKLDAVNTKYGHYGEHTETKYISMLMMTDSHTDWSRVNRCFSLGEDASFDLILHGGDIVEGSGGFATYNWKEKVLACNKPVLAITGNHEHTYVEGSTMYVGLTDEEVHNLLYDNDLVEHNGEVHPTIGGIEKNYYYRDFTKNGVTTRIIALYQFEWNSPVDGEGHPIYWRSQGKDWVFYTQEQIDWFVNTLKSTPEGVGVIVFSHIPISAAKYLDNGFVVPERRNTIHKDTNFLWSFMSNKTFLYSIINAWVNGGVCNIHSAQTTPDSVEHPLSVNTTFDGGGRFIANICGHQHTGGLAYMVDDSDNISPFRVVISPTTNAAYVQNTGWWGRKTSGFTQDCLNCIVYDYDRDKVKVVRFGSNINNDGIECKSYCF